MSLDADPPSADPGGPLLLCYGAHASQWAELTLPASPRAAAPVVVLLHGGFWKAEYGAGYIRALVPSLLAQGWAVLVVEYRRVGDGGGYPATLADVATAVDLLADVDGVGAARVAAVGHSAGGHLAAWLATRSGQRAGSPGSGPSVAVTAVVSLAGVLDLDAADGHGLGGGAVARLLGGTPAQVPERYAVADPAARLPLGVPMLCLQPDDDEDVPGSQATGFGERAAAAGDEVTVRFVPGGHFAVVDPDDPAWATALDWLREHL